jgi:hypothetical protein
MLRGRQAQCVRLSASGGRVCIESKATVAATDAAVLEDGQCSVSRARLLAALEVYRERSTVTLTANDLGLRMGDLSVPVSHYHSQAPPPVAFQIFLATKSGTVSSRPVPRPQEPAVA